MAPDFRRALAAYVSGRNGGWDSELKVPPRAAPPVSASEETSLEPLPHRGVPVPLRLGFERGPGTWRSRLEDASRG